MLGVFGCLTLLVIWIWALLYILSFWLKFSTRNVVFCWFSMKPSLWLMFEMWRLLSLLNYGFFVHVTWLSPSFNETITLPHRLFLLFTFDDHYSSALQFLLGNTTVMIWQCSSLEILGTWWLCFLLMTTRLLVHPFVWILLFMSYPCITSNGLLISSPFEF